MRQRLWTYLNCRDVGMIRREALVQAVGLGNRVHRYRGRSRWSSEPVESLVRELDELRRLRGEGLR